MPIAWYLKNNLGQREEERREVEDTYDDLVCRSLVYISAGVLGSRPVAPSMWFSRVGLLDCKGEKEYCGESGGLH